MRRYETIFILRSDLGETPAKETIKRFEGIVGSSGGELMETDDWGVREMAYRIRGERRGHYVRLDYLASGATTTELERNLKLTDGVIRYLSVMVEPEADIGKVRAEIEAHRQRRAAAQSRASDESEAKAVTSVEAKPEEALPAQVAPQADTTAGSEAAADDTGEAPAEPGEPESGGQPN